MASNGFKYLLKEFLGNRRVQNYEELVNNLLQSYKKLGCNMSQKYTSFTRIWIFSPENCGAVSDEHGECFHRDISSMEKRYQGKWNCAMLADYCWTLARDAVQWNKSDRQNGGNYMLWCYIMNLHEKDCADVQFTL